MVSVVSADLALPALQRAVAWLAQALAAPPRAPLPVTLTVGDALAFVAADAERHVALTLPLAAPVPAATARVELPALARALRGLGRGARVALAFDSAGGLRLQAAAAVHLPPCAADAPFGAPDAAPPAGVTPVELDAAALAAACAVALVAVDRDTVRPALAGVLLQPTDRGLCAVGCDGFRLARAWLPEAVPLTALLPWRTARALAGAATRGPLVVAADAARAQFRWATAVLTTRLVAERYPDVEAVLPQRAAAEAVVDAAWLAAAARTLVAAGALARLTLAEGAVALAARVGGTERPCAEAAGAGSGTATGVYNAAYLRDAARHLAGPVRLRLPADERPLLLEGQHAGCAVQHAIMPMAIRD